MPEEEMAIEESRNEEEQGGEGADWPDPPGSIHSSVPLCDDVSRLNACGVHAVYMPRNEGEVQEIVRHAKAKGLSVSCRGTRHSMGASL